MFRNVFYWQKKTNEESWREKSLHWAIQGGKENQFAWSHMQMRLLPHEIQPFYGNSTGGDRGKVHFVYEMVILFKK